MRCLAVIVLLTMVIAACGDDSSPDNPQTDQGVSDQFVDGTVDQTVDTVPSDLSVDFYNDIVITDMTVDSGVTPDTGVIADTSVVIDSGPTPDTSTSSDAGAFPDTSVDSGPVADQLIADAAVAQCGGTATVVLQEVATGTPDYLSLKNTGGAQVDLSGFRLDMNGISSQTFTIPAGTTLAAGVTVYVFEYSEGLQAGDINTGDNVPFYDEINANSVALWDASGNLLDFVAIGSALLAVPGGVNTTPVAWPANYDSTTHSFQRVANTGTCPNFNASDWAALAITRP